MRSNGLTDLLQTLSQSMQGMDHESPAVIECHVVTSASPMMMGMGVPLMSPSLNNSSFAKAFAGALPTPLPFRSIRRMDRPPRVEEDVPETFFPRRNSGVKIEEVEDDPLSRDPIKNLSIKYLENKERKRYPIGSKPLIPHVPHVPRVLPPLNKNPFRMPQASTTSGPPPPPPPPPTPTLRTPYEKWGDLQNDLYNLPIGDVYRYFTEVFTNSLE